MATKAAKKKAGRPIGIAHNPQIGTIVIMDNGAALALTTDEGHNPMGWRELPGFDVLLEEEPADAGEQ